MVKYMGLNNLFSLQALDCSLVDEMSSMLNSDEEFILRVPKVTM